jgi:hypothetical protein
MLSGLFQLDMIMKLIINCCYSRLLWIMCSGPSFNNAIEGMTITKGPFHQYEGMAGYIETEVEFKIRDLRKFTDLWESYYTLTDKRRLDLYGLAKGLGDCK